MFCKCFVDYLSSIRRTPTIPGLDHVSITRVRVLGMHLKPSNSAGFLFGDISTLDELSLTRSIST